MEESVDIVWSLYRSYFFYLCSDEKRNRAEPSRIFHITIKLQNVKMEEKFFTEGSGHMKINFLLTSSHFH